MGKKKSVKRAMSVDDLNLSDDVSSVSVSPTGASGKTARKRICKSHRVNVSMVETDIVVPPGECVTGRWVCDDRFYGLVNRSNR